MAKRLKNEMTPEQYAEHRRKRNEYRKRPHVRGLHVPWNLQVLEAKQNISKGNRYAPRD